MSKPAWAREMRFKPMPIMPDGCSEFDRFLYKLGISMEDALHSQRVREWVKKNHQTRFVPIAVLEAYGINHKWF